ncbi:MULTISPECIES: RNA-binding cell elongation regulator Jag/EloR [unclassified Bacillus (in: firmicutes)]|uniref:RNA-binding cell elongation regulator Jag/EloR n=1 Tax=unclassified Bacillus (in: firmicutes) TaxID=185979 RepID=UPI000BF161B0|nr:MULTISPECIES: RNA-binding cell elongation regulator Jag/EloR [unclassified Bacillus (in: firmicutes)]PEJ58684.1 protein jag [Bacillus sp. AFS002410]PEL09286.1 protein jag [Bacillus sp. AFS017336]
MREVTATGQTIEQAVQIALQQLSSTEEEVEIKVIEDGKKGFLGFGAKPAKVLVVKKQTLVEKAFDYLSNIVKSLDETADVLYESQEKEQTFLFTIKGEKVALIIGKRGNTLNALQFLVQTFVNRHSKQLIHVVVDAENYRLKRKESLEILARKTAQTVLKTRKAVSLEPMPSFERKIIHHILTDMPNISTKSVGQDPHRKLVIDIKKPIRG